MKTQLIRFGLLAGVLVLFAPVVASSQSWPDYRRDGDYDRDRNYDRYDSRYLRDSINRLDRLASDFQRDVDRTLDRSRENGSRHEDHLNADVQDFRRAVRELKNRFGDGRDLNRSSRQAEIVLDEAAHVEDSVEHHFNDQRLYSEWMAIRQELKGISDAYGIQGGNYGHNDQYRRDGRRNDDYDRRNRNNVPWWQRIPRFPN